MIIRSLMIALLTAHAYAGEPILAAELSPRWTHCVVFVNGVAQPEMPKIEGMCLHDCSAMGTGRFEFRMVGVAYEEIGRVVGPVSYSFCAQAKNEGSFREWIGSRCLRCTPRNNATTCDLEE